MKMKKERVLFFSALLLVLSIIPVSTAEISCSDGSEVVWDQREINLGSAKSINGLRLGVTKTEELNVIKRLTVNLITEGTRVSVSNITDEKVDLSTGTYSVQITNATEDTAVISIEGSSKEVEKEEVKTINSVLVYLTSTVYTGDDSPKADLLIGVKELSLSNDENPTEEHILKNVTYIIELKSASDAQATLRVNKCKTGDIEESIEEEVIVNNTEVTNTTEETNTTASTTNETEEVPSTNTSINQGNITTTPQETKEPGFFRKIANWFKNLFS
jgi:hypothetical protein